MAKKPKTEKTNPNLRYYQCACQHRWSRKNTYKSCECPMCGKVCSPVSFESWKASDPLKPKNPKETEWLHYYCPDCDNHWKEPYQTQYGRCDDKCSVYNKAYTPFDSEEKCLDAINEAQAARDEKNRTPKRSWLVAHPDNYNEFVDVRKLDNGIAVDVKSSSGKTVMYVEDSGNGLTIKSNRMDIHLAYCDLDYLRTAAQAIKLFEDRKPRESLFYELKV